MNNFYIHAGQRIRELRVLNKYTTDELAEKVGISSKFLNNIENGKQGFSGENLYKIAEALHVKCDYIVKGSSESIYSNDIIELLDMFDESQMITLVKILRDIYEIGIY